jgi:hypothetical protein
LTPPSTSPSAYSSHVPKREVKEESDSSPRKHLLCTPTPTSHRRACDTAAHRGVLRRFKVEAGDDPLLLAAPWCQ